MPDNLILRYYIDFLQEGITVGRTADGVKDDEIVRRASSLYDSKFSIEYRNILYVCMRFGMYYILVWMINCLHP